MSQATPSPRAVKMKRYGAFGAVGIINTVVDFTIYNVLHFVFGIGLIRSNIISTTSAMLFSFVMNKRVVFKHHEGHIGRQMLIFFAATAFGLYVLQTGVIVFLTDVWTWPAQAGVALVHLLGLNQYMSDTFVINNGAKAAATVVSMTWNYLIYRKVVFSS